MSARRHSIERRDMLKAVGIAAGATVAATAGSTGATALPRSPFADRDSARERTRPTAPVEAETAELFEPLRARGALGRWNVADVHPVTLGAIPVVLADSDGQRFQVDVLLRDPRGDAPQAVAHSPSLSVFLCNQGDGATPSNEEQGLGAMALGAALSRREADGVRIPGSLWTMRDRVARAPSGKATVLA